MSSTRFQMEKFNGTRIVMDKDQSFASITQPWMTNRSRGQVVSSALSATKIRMIIAKALGNIQLSLLQSPREGCDKGSASETVGEFGAAIHAVGP